MRKLYQYVVLNKTVGVLNSIHMNVIYFTLSLFNGIIEEGEYEQKTILKSHLSTQIPFETH